MELVSIFLDSLCIDSHIPPSSADVDRALSFTNEEYIMRALPFDDLSQELIDLYDSAREFKGAAWPQPLGTAVFRAVRDLEVFEGDDMSGLVQGR